MRTLRALLLLGGLALTGWGLTGLLTDHYIEHPLDIAEWAVGALVLHDALWLPVVCALGATLARRTAVRTALILTAAVTAVALPAVLRAGTDTTNPTVLPLPYLRNWLLVLAAIAVLAGALVLRRRRPGGRSKAEDPTEEEH
ncbi:hypothetical protein [Kitasatospora sp. NPDC094015]|uniref:hypothetical protein n=1 Tax=Kitasatospora sp. NPDC094015 TaxID=3155205 RepID=UPI003330900D